MASAESPSASASEGEIVDMVPAKASKAQPEIRDIPVDRQSRHYTPASASSSESTTDRDASHRWSRSRSRSPYRNSPRREKRRRSGDHGSDRGSKRTFKVHYEDPRDRTQRRPRERFDQSNNRPSGQYHSNSKGIASRGSRSRSRSPFSHKRQDNSSRGSATNCTRTPPVDKITNGEKPSRSVTFQLPEDLREEQQTVESSKRISVADSDTTTRMEDEEVVMDEAAQIEARRQRREALKAKLKSQPSPLLAQALHSTSDIGSVVPKPSHETPNMSRSGRSHPICREIVCADIIT